MCPRREGMTAPHVPPMLSRALHGRAKCLLSHPGRPSDSAGPKKERRSAGTQDHVLLFCRAARSWALRRHRIPCCVRECVVVFSGLECGFLEWDAWFSVGSCCLGCSFLFCYLDFAADFSDSSDVDSNNAFVFLFLVLNLLLFRFSFLLLLSPFFFSFSTFSYSLPCFFSFIKLLSSFSSPLGFLTIPQFLMFYCFPSSFSLPPLSLPIPTPATSRLVPYSPPFSSFLPLLPLLPLVPPLVA